VAVSKGILKQMSEAYRKIRNTARYLLGNLYDFDPEYDRAAYDELTELDRWALLKLHKLSKRVLNAYDNYEFHVVYHAVHNFCAVDMSAFYLDIAKDRVYTSLPDSMERRAAQTVMYEIITSLVRIIAPVLAFTSEELWRYIPRSAGDPGSVQLAEMPQVREDYIDEELEAKWEKIIKARNEIAKVLEQARRDKVIGHSMDASVTVYAGEELYTFLEPVADQLASILIVSRAELENIDNAPGDVFVSEEMPGLKVKVAQAAGGKCERCWTYSEKVGKDSVYTTLCGKCLDVVRQV